jgi:arginine decarboxylase
VDAFIVEKFAAVIKYKDNSKGAFDLSSKCIEQMPLLAAMQGYLAEQVLPFHTPGHKAGKGAHEILRQLLGSRSLSLDLTVVPGLNDLFDKRGPIYESQKLAATLYGADESYFLVNGTTCGIYAMILATVGPGEKIIVPRNIHRSVMGALILSGAIPVFVRPEVDSVLQIAMNVTTEAVEAAIRQHPEAKAVLVINPTYYGVTSDIAGITMLAHQHGMLVLVDEAHGPHFHFSQHLPVQGINAGADLVVQSTHKILGSLSQSSLLLCRKERINVPRLETMLQLVQSSSPNYILLASLEAAFAHMRESGELLVERSVSLARLARRRINEIPGLCCFGAEKIGGPGVFDYDPTKLVVTVAGLGIRGNDAELWLRHIGKVQAELSDANNLLFLVTLADDEASMEQLLRALTLLAAEHAAAIGETAEPFLPLPYSTPSMCMSPREAVFSRQERVEFARSAGRICAETITSYPPGIPILIPGEQITQVVIGYCMALQKQGFTIIGPEDQSLNTVEVVA